MGEGSTERGQPRSLRGNEAVKDGRLLCGGRQVVITVKPVDPTIVYRLLYPTVPVVVAACFEGSTAAMPVASLVSLSNDPPLIGFSSSRSHATYRKIVDARCFSVSWLDRRYAGAIEALGTSSGWKVDDKLRAAGLHHDQRDGTPKVPQISEASARLVCSLEELHKYGDHELVVGRVLEAQADEDFEEYWKFLNYRPILYSGLGKARPDGDAEVTPP